MASLAMQANAVRPRDPTITPSPSLNDPTPDTHEQEEHLVRRGGYGASILSGLGSDIPSYVASGVPNFFQGFPTGDSVVSSLGLSDDQVAALPTNALNLDPYANYTDNGWQIRFRGNIYKQPNTSREDLDRFANVFLIGTNITSLPDDQQDQARNLTAEILVIQQGDVNVSTIHLEPAQNQGSSGEPGGGGAVTASGGTQDITLPYPTTPEGDYDVFVPIDSNGLTAGNDTQQIQRLNTFVTNTTLGNGTAYLVPDEGLTVISDIDDILRVTKIYDPAEGLLNSFARAFTPWENMPSIYANWSMSLPNVHFHYLTTTPEQVTRNYMQFIYSTYPGGSFDTRPLNFSDTFPKRKFVLVADTSNPDVMRDYPQMATDFPGQVQCIFLRNTTATDPSDKFPYNTDGFKNLNQSSYMFFLHPDDLMGIDIAGGSCYNTSIAQNLTFGYQGLPLGAGSTTSINGSANHTAESGAPAAVGSGGMGGLAFFAFVGMLFWQLL